MSVQLAFSSKHNKMAENLVFVLYPALKSKLCMWKEHAGYAMLSNMVKTRIKEHSGVLGVQVDFVLIHQVFSANSAPKCSKVFLKLFL